MNKFSVRDVTELLRGEGIPEMLLDYFELCKMKVKCTLILCYIHTENCIN